MKTKMVLGLTVAFLLSLTVVTGGTWAFLSDVEASSSNQLSAGTLDLKTNDVNGVTATLNDTSVKCNETVSGQTITLKNIGSNNATYLDIVFAYVESDGSPNTTNMTADQAASVFEVTTLTYDGSDLLATSVSDGNVNGYKDIQDVKNATLTNLAGINGGGSTKNFVVSVRLRTGISNNYQGDGVDVTMTFTLKQ